MANFLSISWEVIKRFRNGGGTKLEAERERVVRELNRCKSESNRRYEDKPYTLVNQYYNNLLLAFTCIFLVFTIICITIFLIFHYVYQDDKYKYVIMSFAILSTSCCAASGYYDQLSLLDKKCSYVLMMVPTVFGFVSFSFALLASVTRLSNFWLKFGILSGTFFSFLTLAVLLILLVLDSVKNDCCCSPVLNCCRRFRLNRCRRQELNSYSSYFDQDEEYWNDIV